MLEIDQRQVGLTVRDEQITPKSEPNTQQICDGLALAAFAFAEGLNILQARAFALRENVEQLGKRVFVGIQLAFILRVANGCADPTAGEMGQTFCGFFC